jgi:hypothetical protein
MAYGPNSDMYSRLAAQEFMSFTEIYYRDLMSEPLRPSTQSHLVSKVLFNSILPCTPTTPNLSLLFTYSHKNCVCMSFLSPNLCYISCPSPPIFDHPNNNRRRILILKLFSAYFSSPSCYVPLISKYIPLDPVLNSFPK